MKYRSSHWSLKLLAWLLAAVCLVFGIWAAYIVSSCANVDLYRQDARYQNTWLCRERTQMEIIGVIEQYRAEPSFSDWETFLKDTHLRFILLEEASGKVAASCVAGMDIKVPAYLRNNPWLRESNFVMERGAPGSIFENVYVCDYYFNDVWYGDQSFWYLEEYPEAGDKENGTMYQILCLLPENMASGEGYIGEGYAIYTVWRFWKQDALLIFVACVVGLLSAAVFLFTRAGRRPGEEKIVCTWFDKIWLEVITAGCMAGVFCTALLFLELLETYYQHDLVWQQLQQMIVFCVAAASACGAVAVLCAVSIIVRIKAGTLLKTSLICKVLCVIWKWIKRPCCWVGNLVKNAVLSIGIVPAAAMGIIGFVLVEFLLMGWMFNSYEPAGIVTLTVLYNVLALCAGIWCAAQMKRLRRAAKALAGGELLTTMDTDGMHWIFREHAQDLNAIADGMNAAVEQRMRSERMKTELITNVSHDIKTPLTSIVNYVDLLQKPHTEQEQTQYLEVLQRQAQRLKKLTEDLVEASKAATGNIPVELTKLHVMELLNQAVEEYRAAMEAQKLEIVTSVRGDLHMMADGRLLWRVLDNLLSNVVKYAMPGTRVYVTAAKQNEAVEICVKNISAQPLEMEEAELMERFVRADRSRHTEGSGLGLNIAGSLVRLQNGTFDLTIDGDLFKATITMPCAS